MSLDGSRRKCWNKCSGWARCPSHRQRRGGESGSQGRGIRCGWGGSS